MIDLLTVAKEKGYNGNIEGIREWLKTLGLIVIVDVVFELWLKDEIVYTWVIYQTNEDKVKHIFHGFTEIQDSELALNQGIEAALNKL